MEFELCPRDPAEIFGQWRLATVEEARKGREENRKKFDEILGSGVAVRLLDGCVDGKGEIEKGFNPDIRSQKMLLIKTNVSRPENGSFVPEMYEGVDLDTEGKYAAIKLSEQDKITEVVYAVLYIHANQKPRVSKDPRASSKIA